MRRCFALWYIAILAVGACRGERPADRASAGSATSMADSLKTLAALARLNPTQNVFLNRARAQSIMEEAKRTGQLADPQLRYYAAQERLLGGLTREAISMLEPLQRDASANSLSVTAQSKPFYDLLAIAYLRLGEQQNCQLNPSADACILPLANQARHVEEAGARKAASLYGRMLHAFPDDRGSRWLLNLSQLAVGEYPAKVDPRYLIPGLGGSRVAAFPRFLNIASNVGTDVDGLSGGLSVADFNGDGLLDLFTTSFGIMDPPHLLIADGRGGYADRTIASGLAGIVGGLNNVHADYDNDGDEDILILRGAWLGDAGVFPNSLLRNRGDGTFDDVTFQVGLGRSRPTHSAAWADFNRDGWLDLFVGHESGRATGGTSYPSALFVSNGNGTFSEVPTAVGIAVDAFVKGVTWGDVNNDGLPDLYVSILGEPNRLFLNRSGRDRAAWRFEEVPNAGGAALPSASFATWFWDYNNDGWEDVLALSYDIRNGTALHDAVAQEYLGQRATLPLADGRMADVEPTRLYRNNRNGTFTDVSADVGLTRRAIFAMGANFGDLDNDGWLDFYVGTGNPDFRSLIPNRMFRSVDGKRFEDVSVDGGFAHLQKGHATAFADFDRDGDADVYMVMGGAYEGDTFRSVLFENPGWKGRHWLTLELEGRAANRSAIGARVAIDVITPAATTRTIYRTIGTGGSFGAGSLQVLVGLGDATAIRDVRVEWPDLTRSTSAFGSLAMDRAYRIVQGTAPVELTRPLVPFRASTGLPVHANMPKLR